MILDADKEGFLRSTRSLIQIIGRCARNSEGRVVLYADEMTDSIMNAVSETNRRREIQMRYNEEHHIVPKTIKKEIREVFDFIGDDGKKDKKSEDEVKKLLTKGPSSVPEEEKTKLIGKLEKEMAKAAKELDFERAAELRDTIIMLKGGATS